MNTIAGKILVIDDEEKIRSILSLILRDAGYDVETATDGVDALHVLNHFHPQIIVADLQMPRMDGIETLLQMKQRDPSIIGIILTAHGTIQSAVQAMKQGVYDYITKPFDNEQLLLIIRRAFDVYRLTAEVDQLKSVLHGRYSIKNIIGESQTMLDVKKLIIEIAATDATVIIEGESGTGKEFAARAIHYESMRKNNPLVIVDCSAIPTNLIETEFFGHERGAFTDARELRIGKFEEANTGTIFMDEISELLPEAQTKLLRVLQEKEFTRIGSTESIKVDVRVIAATNRILEEHVRDGKFREDLYYRLNVLKLSLPPLRKHTKDIPLYVNYFLEKYRSAFHKNITGISHEALEYLHGLEWKGNIRELENTVQRAMLNAKGTLIDKQDICGSESDGNFFELDNSANDGLEESIRRVAEKTERQLILNALCRTDWNRTAAAEQLQISRKTLFNKIQHYGLDPEKTK
jgi:DNA-binding NtrC family response regulator